MFIFSRVLDPCLLPFCPLYVCKLALLIKTFLLLHSLLTKHGVVVRAVHTKPASPLISRVMVHIFLAWYGVVLTAALSTDTKPAASPACRICIHVMGLWQLDVAQFSWMVVSVDYLG